ncbi:hypothetical protein ACOTH5_31855 [Achromobacter xylosoxidans]|uniref:hypothetical protein n=1 Tax=Alcaligenes xylosoxydans xylosoxydans TaxID=85698 RepID=UPI00047B9CEC|nr:hypothetical protein [Achromobacter xylosoxidans]QQE59172.1 hypothetical protein I6H41_09300 [Achromobacter xylosoxidans]QQV12916.1 hypothetical protein I6I48_24420 [Achromobacter xylosoxidans]WPQ33696.1 hypothetical protein SLH34_24165 [Achromobacter xylosoxidans]
MARIPDSKLPASPPIGAQPGAIRVRHDGNRTRVEVGGVQLRYLTSVGVSLGGWGQLPEVRVSMAPAECDVQIEDGVLVIDGVDMPDGVLRSLYIHLRDKYSFSERWPPPAPDSFADAARAPSIGEPPMTAA